MANERKHTKKKKIRERSLGALEILIILDRVTKIKLRNQSLKFLL